MSMNVNDKNLGHATAYAYYKAGGGTMTEAEFTEFMADFGTASQTAVEAAQAALASKNTAQTAATTATNKASEATTAATTATTKAGEASTSASTATSAKDTAVSASQTATTKATEATTAAATATSAKTDAVAANTAAQSAKTAAQTAQTGAETAAASVQSSAEQIATNTEDIAQLKSDLTTKADATDMLKAFPTDTASGSVASFADGANVPVKSLVVNIDPVQSDSGDPSPSNVRTISGLSEVNVVVSEKNLFNENAYVEMGIESQGGSTYYIAGRNMLFAPVKSGETYTISVGDLGTASYFYFGTYATSPLATAIPAKSFGQVEGTVKTITIPSTANYVACFFGTGKPVNAQLEKSSDATPYESITSINIALGQTVYGGTLDVLSGVLTVDRKLLEINGNCTRWTSPTGDWIGANTPTITDMRTGRFIDLINNMFPSADGRLNEWNIYAVDKRFYMTLQKATVGDSAELFNAWFASNPVQVIYPLATPLTIQLTPHEVTALLGANNIWADSGDSEVVYRADPTLYIQRLTEPDADMVADSNITSGSYFMVGNTLYKATANIASGATISPNVNCTRKSLSEALNELNA